VVRYNLDSDAHLYHSLAEFRHHIRRFLHYSEQAAREHGLEPQQHQLLLAVKGLPEGIPPSIAEIAARLQLRHHTTVELIHRMEARDLLGRQLDPEDRRQVLIHLTQKGEDVLLSLSLAHRTELETMGPALMKALRRVLKES
jgi:DNA-binding MarR family transcriptional regulator